MAWSVDRIGSEVSYHPQFYLRIWCTVLCWCSIWEICVSGWSMSHSNTGFVISPRFVLFFSAGSRFSTTLLYSPGLWWCSAASASASLTVRSNRSSASSARWVTCSSHLFLCSDYKMMHDAWHEEAAPRLVQNTTQSLTLMSISGEPSGPSRPSEQVSECGLPPWQLEVALFECG